MNVAAGGIISSQTVARADGSTKGRVANAYSISQRDGNGLLPGSRRLTDELSPKPFSPRATDDGRT